MAGLAVVAGGSRPGWSSLLLVGFWLLVTYLLLPRLHRILTRLYVPGYFIGRTRTSDGLLGDPVNLALLGSEPQVHTAMRRAGWTRADDLSVRTGRRIVLSTLRGQSYQEAPVSPLHLFDRQQDFAYQQEVAGSPSKRHHVRFWRCPPGWALPGGYSVDWLAAGTYDRSVGLSLFTFQVTHKIEQDTDVERDHLLTTVTAAEPAASVTVIRNFSSGYHSRNGGGDLIQTDGHLPVVDLRAVEPGRAVERDTDSRDRRPAQVVFGALVAAARATAVTTLALLLLAGAPVQGVPLAPSSARAGGVLLLGVAIVDLALAVGVFRGHNGARILVMLLSVLTISTAYLGSRPGTGAGPTSTLPTVALSILVLLALSSHRARDWAARARRLSEALPDSG